MAGAVMVVRTIRLALLLILLVVLQTTVFPHLRIAGVVPDLGLVAAVAIAVRYGPELGAGFGFAAGFASDVFLQTPLGLAALAVGLTAYLVGAMQGSLARPAWWINPAVAFGAGIAAGLPFIGLGAVVGQEQLVAVHSLRIVVVAALYDGAIALVVFPLAIAAARPREILGVSAPRYGAS